MKIAPIIFSSVVLCLVYANTAQSFALTKKLVAVKEPIFAAKVQFVRDVKDKVVLVANKAFLLKKKAALAIATPIVAIKDWKKALLAKKLAKIAGPIIALKNLKRAIIDKKLNTLASIIPAAAGFGLGGLAHTSEGYAFTEWNGTPFQPNDASSFVLVPEEYTNYHVEDSAASRTFGQSGDYLQSTFANVQSTLESIGDHVPFLNTLTNGVSSFKQSLHPKPVYQFVPDLGFHQYHNVHYEPSVPVVVPTAPESVVVNTYEQEQMPPKETYGTPKETYGPPSPYPPPAPELPELPTLPEVPHVEYGIPTTTTTTLAPPQEYGPPPTNTYGPPPTFTTSSFQIPKTSYGVPQGPAYHYTQRF